MKRKVLISITIALFGMAIIHACSSAVYQKGDVQMNKIEESPQYKEGKFKKIIIQLHGT